MLSRLRVETTPSVLWCYKTEPSVTAGCKKRSRQLKKAASRGVLHGNGNEPLELFVAQANLRWCYYRDTVQIMGSTFSVVVLQDFEALTPNLLARTVETVEGGGFIVILIQSIASLTQLYSMSMDVHKKFNAATALKNHEWRHWASVTPRFNERFVLSFADCDRCVVMDDEWNILPLSRNWAQSHSDQGNMLPPMNAELSAMVASACVSPWTRRIVSRARTCDQARALLQAIEVLRERHPGSASILTSPRGRGKYQPVLHLITKRTVHPRSSALGLCLAAALFLG
mmetsp:Transcript_21955/g.68685  ORF Transcript_21955/g.68685 Transcript_21955/m.68685 type:complete len:285 (-) Transcript_21955:3527-4381(-)